MEHLSDPKGWWKRLEWPLAVYRAALASPLHLPLEGSGASDRRPTSSMPATSFVRRPRTTGGDGATISNELHPYSWLLTASRMNGTPLFDNGGHPAGHISDVSLDKTSGQAVYALIAIGGDVGLPELFYPLPWWLLQFDRRKQGYVVPVPISTIQAGPCLTREEVEWFGADDSAWRERLAIYYSPYASPET
jgi:hypothetical protein